MNEPVLYLAPTTQLVNQTLEKAKALGIAAVPYQKGEPLDDAFVNGKAIMVATYKALFNGKSKFGVRGSAASPIKVGVDFPHGAPSPRAIPSALLRQIGGLLAEHVHHVLRHAGTQLALELFQVASHRPEPTFW
jgi:hypothetical protein